MKRPDDLDRVRDAAPHILGLLPDLDDLLLFDRNGDDGGLVEQDLPRFGKADTRGAEVNAEFF
jgi:hypothetical protein